MKKFLSILLAALLTAGITACGKDTASQQGNESGSKSSGDSQAKTVTLAVWGSGASDSYNNAAEEFNSRQDDINFVVEMQADWETYIGAKIASNDLPDMFFVNPYANVYQYAQNGRLLDLSDQPFVDRIYDSAKEAVTYDGTVYAYPMCVQFLGLFYNIDLFEQAGITEKPETLDDLKTACETLKANNITPFAATYLEDWTLNHAYSTLLGAVLDDWDGHISELNSEAGTFGVPRSDEIFDFFDLMMNNSSENFMDANSTAGFNALANGDAAMLFSGEFSLLNLDSVNPDLNVGLIGVPISNDPAETKIAVDVGITVGINPNGDRVEESLRVLDYMSDNTDTSGWINHYGDSLGAAPPAMDYNMSHDFKYYKDYKDFVDSGKTQAWLFLQWEAGFASGPSIQNYFSGTMNRNETIANLDETYRNNLE